MRIAEIKKDAYEFKRDIVTGAENFRTGKTMAEKALRYMEEKLRSKSSTAEKLKLKSSTLKSQVRPNKSASSGEPAASCHKIAETLLKLRALDESEASCRTSEPRVS